MFTRTILIKAGQRLEKQKMRALGCSFLPYFLSLHPRKTTLPCKQSSCSPCSGPPGRDRRAHGHTITAALCQTYRDVICSSSVLDSTFITAKCVHWGPACT